MGSVNWWGGWGFAVVDEGGECGRGGWGDDGVEADLVGFFAVEHLEVERLVEALPEAGGGIGEQVREHGHAVELGLGRCRRCVVW